jgi:hypothetical protein
MALAACLAAGCTVLLPPRDTPPPPPSLAEADGYVARNDYPGAVAAYDAFLARYPDDDRVPHVRAVRAVIAELIAVRDELATLRERVPARDAEVARLRHELTARQAEVARLRDDLEALKRTDLQMERRRR